MAMGADDPHARQQMQDGADMRYALWVGNQASEFLITCDEAVRRLDFNGIAMAWRQLDPLAQEIVFMTAIVSLNIIAHQECDHGDDDTEIHREV